MQPTPERPPRTLARLLPQLLAYGLSLGCLAWVLHGYPMQDLLPAVRSLDWRWVLLAVVSDLTVYIVHGWRWRTLLLPVVRVRFWRTVQAIYIGLFTNEILPLRTGELVRCYLLAHWNDLRISLGFASAALERIIDGFWMLVAFFITASLIKGIPRDLIVLVNILGGLLALCAIALLWIVLRKHEAHAVFRESKWASTVRHVIEGLHLMGNPRTLGITALISLLYLALQALTVYALMKAFGLDLSFWVAAGVLTVVRIGTMIPNMPGNLGLSQASCVIALHRLFEVEQNDAKTFSFILFVAVTMPLLVGGAIALGVTGLDLRELTDRARRGMHSVHRTHPREELKKIP